MHARFRRTAPVRCAASYMLSLISGQTVLQSGALPTDPCWPVSGSPSPHRSNHRAAAPSVTRCQLFATYRSTDGSATAQVTADVTPAVQRVG